MAHQTLTRTAGRPYDDFTGQVLNARLWRFAEYPTGDDSGSRRCEEPGARTEVGEGTLDLHVWRFEQSHGGIQRLDDDKHHLVSVRSFLLPADSSTTISVEMAATNINATGRDYRDGFAAFRLIGVGTEREWLFQIGHAGERIFGSYYRGGAEPAGYGMDTANVPYGDRHVDAGVSHLHAVTLDPSRGVVTWQVDRNLIYESSGSPLPRQIRIGVGLSTSHPIAAGISRSLHGQGMSASFGPIQVTAAER
jgi:hypothetical protein